MGYQTLKINKNQTIKIKLPAQATVVLTNVSKTDDLCLLSLDNALSWVEIDRSERKLGGLVLNRYPSQQITILTQASCEVEVTLCTEKGIPSSFNFAAPKECEIHRTEKLIAKEAHHAV